MEKMIRAGFVSPTLSLEQDITVDELLDLMAEHVSLFEEFAKAGEMLMTSVWDAGRYDGTGWYVWFVRKEDELVLH
jgi:hypothetical protein